MAFFILPGIFKQFKAAKKKSAAPVKAKKNPSLFDKIGKKIQQVVRELEQQAKQKKQEGDNQASPNQASMWDALAEDQTPSQKIEMHEQEDDYYPKPETLISEAEKQPFHAAIEELEKDNKPHSKREPILRDSGSKNLVFKSNPLQNAVIWSEILGKPVGLR